MADTRGMRPTIRHEALLLEALPTVAGAVALALTPLSFWLQRWLDNESGEPVSTSQLTVWGPFSVLFFVVLLFFGCSGIGWMTTGRLPLGMALFFVRGYVALTFVLWAMGGSEGDSWYDSISQREALITFAIAMTVSALSVIALAYSTSSQLRRQQAEQTSEHQTRLDD